MSARARRRCQTKSAKGTASFGKPSIKGRHVSQPNIWTEHTYVGPTHLPRHLLARLMRRTQ
ncbi:unnamed protein product [Sphenostylis stenocarpa]|uniref:Uncharacterized protein n=1 Tax=Sphenostylis stenocarpa TaxID=92480 RepID=A0AA86SYZ7_9FABA|nr:unnamed protein product [Sphenostylis stenocarpa]